MPRKPASPLSACNKNRKRVQAELAARELARKRLINFVLRFQPDYKVGWVHQLTAAKLERFSWEVAQETEPRLMIFMPPRTGKSELVSTKWPAWHLGHYPSHDIITASYAVSLPMGFSRKIKEMLTDPAYQVLFPETLLHKTARATEGWYTTRGGMYIPAGVQLGITGKGANIFIIDDPVKDAAEADSDIVSEATWAWWDSVAETRLAPGAGVVVVQTRWSDKDLAGRLLSQEKENLREIDELIDVQREILEETSPGTPEHRQARASLEQFERDKETEVTHWEVVSFPALAEHDEYLTPQGSLVQLDEAPEAEGFEAYKGSRLLRNKDEALHPERYSKTFFKRKRRSSSPRVWSALYQQNPVPADGEYFTKDMFRYTPSVPSISGWHVYIAWDLAVGRRQHNDWTVGMVGALDYDGNLHLIHQVRVRTPNLAPLIVGTAEPYHTKLQLVGLEQGHIQMSVMPIVHSLMQNKPWTMAFDETLAVQNDKVARARTFQGLLQMGRVYLPENQPWVSDYVAELLRFPNGVFDDRVDASAHLANMVVKASAPERPKYKRNKQLRSWKDRLKDHQGKRGRTGHMAA